MLEQEKVLTPSEIELFKEAVEADIADKRYFIYGFCALFSVETGVRAGEIPSPQMDRCQGKFHTHTRPAAVHKGIRKEVILFRSMDQG